MRSDQGRAPLDGVNVAKEESSRARCSGGDSGSATPTSACSTGPVSSPRSLTSPTVPFRFFAGEGDWTLRTLAPQAEPVDNPVHAEVGSVAEVTVAI